MFGITWRLLAQFLVDTLAIVLLSTVTAAPVELTVVGLTLDQTIDARWRGAVVNVLTGGLYGVFRKWVFYKKFRAHEGGWLKKFCADLAAFVCIQVPIYAIVLVLAGANTE